jgi:hypothetical protein
VCAVEQPIHLAWPILHADSRRIDEAKTKLEAMPMAHATEASSKDFPIICVGASPGGCLLDKAGAMRKQLGGGSVWPS